MTVETESRYLGDLIGDINRRRGTILEQVERGTNTALVATIPLSEKFGYFDQQRPMSGLTPSKGG